MYVCVSIASHGSRHWGSAIGNYNTNLILFMYFNSLRPSGYGTSRSPLIHEIASSSSSSSVGPLVRPPAGLSEHRKLFRAGFQPSKIYNHKPKGKGPSSGKPPLKKVKQISYWKKNSMCLADCHQTVKPTPQERIQLEKIGLTTKVLTFETEGTARHVHDIITTEFPILQECGGYTLLRLAENSHNLVEIEEPLDGLINVQYLKEILNNAVLYIGPL